MQENKTIKATYEAPQVEVYEVLVEQGFSASGGNEPLGAFKDDIEW